MTMPRETGSEKSERACPTCGGPMQVSESAYGSITAKCPTCDGSPEPQRQQADQNEQREVGTDVNEGAEDA